MQASLSLVSQSSNIPEQKQSPTNLTASSINKSGQLKTKRQYINFLLDILIKEPHLQLLIHGSMFSDLHKIINQYFLTDWNKNLIIKLLEDYIKFSLSQILQQNGGISGQINKIARYQQIDKFGKIYGAQINRILTEVRNLASWARQSLAYSQKFRQNQFDLKANSKQLISLIQDISPVCQKQFLSCFYVPSYMVRCARNMEKQKVKPVQICQILAQRLRQLKHHYKPKYLSEKSQQKVKIKTITNGVNSQSSIVQCPQKEQQNKDRKQHQAIIIKLTGGNAIEKLNQLQAGIVNLINQTKRNIPIISQIFNNNCKENECTNLKLILKLNGKDNVIAMQRIKQKLIQDHLSKQLVSYYDNKSLTACNTIDQWLKNENLYIRELSLKIIGQLQEIKFNVTDLLVGKALFQKVESITNTIKCIQDYVQKLNEKQDGNRSKRINILRIQNRLHESQRDMLMVLQISGIAYELQFMLKSKRAKNQLYEKISEILRQQKDKIILSPLLQLIDWGQKSIRSYLTMLENENMPSSSQKDKEKQRMAIDNLIDFLLASKQGGSVSINRSRQQKNKDQGQMQRLITSMKEQVKSTGQNYERIKQVSKLATIQYLYQLGQYQKIMEIKDSQQFYTNRSDNAQVRKAKEYMLILANQQFNIGLTYYMLNKYPQSVFYYNKCLTKRIQELGQQHAQCASVINNMGLSQKAMKQYDTALQDFNKALRIKQKVKGKYNADYASTLVNIGIVYRCREQYQEAVRSFRAGLSIYQQQKKQSLQLSNILSNIGLCYDKIGNHPQSLKYYGRSLFIKQLNRGEDDGQSKNILKTIRQLYAKLGINIGNRHQYGKSRVSGTVNESRDDEQYQWRHIQYYMILQDIAGYEIQHNNYNNAIDYLKQQLKVHEGTQVRNIQSNSKDRGKIIKRISTLNSLQSTFYENGNYEQLIQYSQKLLTTVGHEYGDNSVAYADQLNNIGLAYSKLGNYSSAIQNFSQSLQIYDQAQPKSANMLAILNNIGLVYYKLKDYGQAIKYYQKSIQIAKSTNKQLTIEYGRTLNNKGLAHRKNKQYTEALNCFEKSLQIIESAQGKETLEYACLLNNIGSVYYYTGQMQKSLQIYQKSLEIKLKRRGEQSEQYKDTLSNIIAVKQRIGRLR